jgi:hypothetical protein
MRFNDRSMALLGIPDLPADAFKKEGGKIKLHGGGSPPPQPTSTTQTQTTIPEYAKPYVERMLGKTEALSNTPYQAYGGERIAGFTPLQQQAFQGVQNMQTASQLGTGTQMAGLAGLQGLTAGQQYAQQAMSPGAMGAYMSPFTQLALEPQMREAARRSGMEGQMQQAQAAQRGAFGGARTAIVEAERQRNLGQLQSDIYGRGMQTAFEQARQAQQFGADLGLRGAGMGLQAANTMGQLGQAQFGQQKDILQGQLSAGAQQRELEQKRLTQREQDFINQRQYPYQQLAFMSDMLRGLPLSQQAQTMYQAPPSFGAQVAGAGIGLMGAKQAGLFGAEGGVVPGGLASVAANKLARG